MKQQLYPVDVISVCNTDGEILPLRVRLEEGQQLLRINIEAVVKSWEIPHVGTEARVYLCRGRIFGQEILFELKYTFRSHVWCLVKKLS